jgi:hypothetical protein
MKEKTMGDEARRREVRETDEQEQGQLDTGDQVGDQAAAVQLSASQISRRFGIQLKPAAPASDQQKAAMLSWSQIQMRYGGGGKEGSSDIHATVVEGIKGPATELPHGDRIQESFGKHDVSGVEAHIGGPAAEASKAIGAEAYTTGDQVAFSEQPSLHTAAHEAAHVVQQRSGVQLKGGVGEAGDLYEQQADRAADAVVRGESAEDLLDHAASTVLAGAIQRKTSESPKTKEQPSWLGQFDIAEIPMPPHIAKQPPPGSRYYTHVPIGRGLRGVYRAGVACFGDDLVKLHPAIETTVADIREIQEFYRATIIQTAQTLSGFYDDDGKLSAATMDHVKGIDRKVTTDASSPALAGMHQYQSLESNARAQRQGISASNHRFQAAVHIYQATRAKARVRRLKGDKRTKAAEKSLLEAEQQRREERVDEHAEGMTSLWDAATDPKGTAVPLAIELLPSLFIELSGENYAKIQALERRIDELDEEIEAETDNKVREELAAAKEEMLKAADDKRKAWSKYESATNDMKKQIIGLAETEDKNSPDGPDFFLQLKACADSLIFDGRNLRDLLVIYRARLGHPKLNPLGAIATIEHDLESATHDPSALESPGFEEWESIAREFLDFCKAFQVWRTDEAAHARTQIESLGVEDVLTTISVAINQATKQRGADLNPG